MFALSPDSALPAAAGGDAQPPPWANHSARFTARVGSTCVVVDARGELDASNATALADYADTAVVGPAGLVVDLNDLEFFGTAGFSALHLINVRCAGARRRWAVVPSAAVLRLLRICDPDRTLPLVESVDAFRDSGGEPDPDRLFQFVP